MKKLLFLFLLALAPALVQAQASPNLAATILASRVVSTSSVVTADQNNASWRGADILVNVSAWTSGTVTPTVQGKDPVSGNYYTVLTGPAISATGTTKLTVYPGGSVASTTTTPAILPRVWRVSLAGTATPVMTLSIGANLAN